MRGSEAVNLGRILFVKGIIMTKDTVARLTSIIGTDQDIKEVVSEIESSIKMTKGHYLKYSQIIRVFSEGQGQEYRAAVGEGLIMAGADHVGVSAALNLINQNLL